MDTAWLWLHRATPPRRGRGLVGGAFAATACVIIIAIVATVLARRSDDESAVSAGSMASPPAPSSSAPSTTAAAPPIAPYIAGPGSFGRFVERATRTPDGTRHLTLALPNGQQLPLSFAEDAVDLVGSLALSETVYADCPPPDPGCGYAEPYAYATEDVSPARTLETLPGADGQDVQLVELPGVGRALRYIRPGWTVQVLLFNIPESAYYRWSTGLIPVVDDDGWLQLRTSGGLRLGSGGGLNPVVTLENEDAFVSLVIGTSCNPANDENTPIAASKCQPTPGVNLNVTLNALNPNVEPDVVGRLISAISVG